ASARTHHDPTAVHHKCRLPRLRKCGGRRHLRPVADPADVQSGRAGEDDPAGRGPVDAGEVQEHLRHLAGAGAPLAGSTGAGSCPPPSNLPGIAGVDQLIDGLERSYRETQERMSDPAVYNDHREAAEIGRRLKELEGPHRLAQEWQAATTDLEEARADGDLRELVPELEQRVHDLEEELKLA